MKKHYIGAIYDVNKENMNNLIKELEEVNKQLKIANIKENILVKALEKIRDESHNVDYFNVQTIIEEAFNLINTIIK